MRYLLYFVWSDVWQNMFASQSLRVKSVIRYRLRTHLKSTNPFYVNNFIWNFASRDEGRQVCDICVINQFRKCQEFGGAWKGWRCRRIHRQDRDRRSADEVSWFITRKWMGMWICPNRIKTGKCSYLKISPPHPRERGGGGRPAARRVLPRPLRRRPPHGDRHARVERENGRGVSNSNFRIDCPKIGEFRSVQKIRRRQPLL